LQRPAGTRRCSRTHATQSTTFCSSIGRACDCRFSSHHRVAGSIPAGRNSFLRPPSSARGRLSKKWRGSGQRVSRRTKSGGGGKAKGKRVETRSGNRKQSSRRLPLTRAGWLHDDHSHHDSRKRSTLMLLVSLCVVAGDGAAGTKKKKRGIQLEGITGNTQPTYLSSFFS
jgi:hypothetical protein